MNSSLTVSFEFEFLLGCNDFGPVLFVVDVFFSACLLASVLRLNQLLRSKMDHHPGPLIDNNIWVTRTRSAV